ncbi:2-oxo acid dehydrogenase subunit E2, partial [Halobium palmae]
EAATEPAESATDAGGRTVAERVPIEGTRQVMFDRMQTVSSEYGSTTTIARVDVTELLDLYEQLSESWDHDLSITAFVLRAVAQNIGDYPELNAEVSDEALTTFEDVNLGIAVNTDNGLLVPTIYDADERTLRELGDAVTSLAKRAGDGELDYDEMQNGTFTVSNAGGLGAYINTPQINPPQTGVLGVCTVFDQPAVVDGDVVPRKMMHLSLTYDHRVVEGATAVTFLQSVKDALEAPTSLLS